MNAPPGAGAGRLVGTVVSALIGALSLLICVGIVVLTGDGGSASSTVTSPFGDSGGPGGPGNSGPRAGTSQAGPDIAACTATECPAIGPPERAPSAFPYPPGTTAPEWTDDFCAGNQTLFDDVRQVRMSLTAVRDWYLNHLLDAGYGWGQYGPLHANPFTKDDAGNDVVLGWDGPLTTSDPARSGRLAIEHVIGRQAVCGPPKGAVFIQVDLP